VEPIEYDDYEEGSWDQWERTLIAHKNRMSREDLNAYLPSPKTIGDRKEVLKWLQEHEFPSNFICGVMQYDHPGINLVRGMVEKMGPKKTLEKLTPFLMKTEYDDEV